MSLSLRWVDESEYDRVVEARMWCYGTTSVETERLRESPSLNRKTLPGACLLAERNGRSVGTATVLDFRMWVRGGAVPCQGVAWVGTAKTSRRSSNSADEPGVATAIMRETLRLAREKGQVVSALMPFRGSFYEHFGYGIMERRANWDVPIEVFPQGAPSQGLRFLEPGDMPELVACRQRVAQAGQCDIERSAEYWATYVQNWGTQGQFVVDRPRDDGPVHGWMNLQHVHEADGSDTIRVFECGYENVDALRRQLHFLGSLRDQYSRALLTLPIDLQLNRLLREPQITHRDNKNHPTPECRPYTRMQLRVLDHKRFIEAMKLPEDVRGRVAVTVHETEGNASRLWIDIDNGHARVTPTEGQAQFECRDTTWAAVVTGDLPASEAVRLGLSTSTDAEAISLLDTFARGPLPFTHEYF